jgi:hypothetical protein
MMGSSQHPCLSAKAKESHGLLAFAAELLETNDFSFLGPEGQLQHKMLARAAAHALAFDDLVQSTPRHIDPATQNRMMTEFLTHCSFLVRSGSDRIENNGVCLCARITLPPSPPSIPHASLSSHPLVARIRCEKRCRSFPTNASPLSMHICKPCPYRS